MSGDSVRVLVEAVADDLNHSALAAYDGRHLDDGECTTLAAFLLDLCDMHDEQAIDLEKWPTLAGFANRYLFEVCADGSPA